MLPRISRSLGNGSENGVHKGTVRRASIVDKQCSHPLLWMGLSTCSGLCSMAGEINTLKLLRQQLRARKAAGGPGGAGGEGRVPAAATLPWGPGCPPELLSGAMLPELSRCGQHGEPRSLPGGPGLCLGRQCLLWRRDCCVPSVQPAIRLGD